MILGYFQLDSHKTIKGTLNNGTLIKGIIFLENHIPLISVILN